MLTGALPLLGNLAVGGVDGGDYSGGNFFPQWRGGLCCAVMLGAGKVEHRGLGLDEGLASARIAQGLLGSLVALGGGFEQLVGLALRIVGMRCEHFLFKLAVESGGLAQGGGVRPYGCAQMVVEDVSRVSEDNGVVGWSGFHGKALADEADFLWLGGMHDAGRHVDDFAPVVDAEIALHPADRGVGVVERHPAADVLADAGLGNAEVGGYELSNSHTLGG